jgi:Sigma-70 factor, region 1.2
MIALGAIIGDLVRLYLTDIGQYALLTKDDEVRSAMAIEAGKDAIEAFNAGGKENMATRGRELRRTAWHGAEAERQFVECGKAVSASPAPAQPASPGRPPN